MPSVKKKLLNISSKVKNGRKLSSEEIDLLVSFNKENKENSILSFLKKSAVPLAIVCGLTIAIFPQNIGLFVEKLPWWTNLPPQAVLGADYVWNIIGEPVGRPNILYHLPNIVLYSFGIVGIKRIFDAIDRKTWVDKVLTAKKNLQELIAQGTVPLLLKKGHTVLFIGKGDFIGQQYAFENLKKTAIIAEQKPAYTNLWNSYSSQGGFEDLERVFERVCSKDTGEYVFFPVRDDQIFLPSQNAYDLSPHMLDILCQDIRLIEKKNKWRPKRIIIVGDKLHKSFVQSEDIRGKVKGSEDVISISSIANKYPNITLLDPTDIVLRQILKMANGRKIAFRATKEGIGEYKKRFYDRLAILGYKEKAKKKGILTIGYDLFEDLTEQQTLSRKVNDYYPVVLSKQVKDALIRNGYGKDEFIFVPDLVLSELSHKTSEQ